MIRAAVPVVQTPDQCAEQLPHWNIDGDQLCIVDNTVERAWERLAADNGWAYIGLGRNVGISGGWNLARAWHLGHELVTEDDHLFLFSASVVWLSGLADALDRVADLTPDDGVLTDMAWHALSLSTETLERAGTWDENLWPGYYNDNDYGRRLELLKIHAGGHAGEVFLPKIRFEAEGDARCETARALKGGLITPGVDFMACERYMTAKWGAHDGHGHLTTPFGLPVEVGWWSQLHRPGLEGLEHP